MMNKSTIKNKMKTLAELKRVISVSPDLMDHNILKNVFGILKNKYEKVCDEKDGMIFSIEKIIDIENVISKDGIYIHFNVTFSAIVVKPEKNLPLSFKPTLILSKGIFGKLYDHINIFIPSVNMGGWTFSEEENVFKNKEDRIDKETMIDATIKDIKYNTTKYNCICNFVKI